MNDFGWVGKTDAAQVNAKNGGGLDYILVMILRVLVMAIRPCVPQATIGNIFQKLGNQGHLSRILSSRHTRAIPVKSELVQPVHIELKCWELCGGKLPEAKDREGWALLTSHGATWFFIFQSFRLELGCSGQKVKRAQSRSNSICKFVNKGFRAYCEAIDGSMLVLARNKCEENKTLVVLMLCGC